MKFLRYALFLLPALTAQAATEVQVSDARNKAVSDIIVYLTPLEGQTYANNPETIEVGQKDLAFTPYLTVGQKGQAVSFQNDDDITHHIYSAVGDNKFSFKIKAGQTINKNDFSQSGVVPMGCNIHDWMGGYLLLVDTPLYNKTNKKGAARFEQELSGKFKLTVWHPQLQTPDNQQEQIVELTAGKTIAVKLNGKLAPIPEQVSDDDFDFLSDYE